MYIDIQGVRKLYFRFLCLVAKKSFKILFQNSNHMKDQLKNFSSGAGLVAAAH
jgi:hypothetical protein